MNSLRWKAMGGVLVLMLAACGGGRDISAEQRAINCTKGLLGACDSLPGTGAASTATVGGTGTTGTNVSSNAIVLRPSALTPGDCTTNVPFIFSGGTPPYTILTTDNFKILASSAQRLGSDYFFLASVGPLIGRSPTLDPVTKEVTYKFTETYPPATLTVLDSQQRTAATTLTFPVIHIACHDNPVLQISPASANAHETEILAFQVTGGDGTIKAVEFNNDNVALVGQGTGAFAVQAKKVGSTLITVTSGDDQKANIVFTVLPLQK